MPQRSQGKSVFTHLRGTQGKGFLFGMATRELGNKWWWVEFSCLSQLFAVCFFHHMAQLLSLELHTKFRVALPTPFQNNSWDVWILRFPRNHEIKLPSSTGLEQSHQLKPFLSPAGSTTSKAAHHFLVALASFNSSSMEAAWRRFRNINSVEHWKNMTDLIESFNINWLITRKKN